MKLSRLSKRERYSLYAAAGFILLYAAVEFAASPLMEKRTRLSQGLETQTETLKQMRILQAEMEELKRQNQLSAQHASARPKDFKLFSFLEDVAGKSDLKDSIVYMKPSKNRMKNSPLMISTVEMKIQGINLKQLTPFLHRVETSRNRVQIRRASITKKEKKGFIDVILQVEAIES